MADALDILEVDRMDGPELTKEFFLGPNAGSSRKSGPKAPAAKRPDGMSREVFELIKHDAVDAPLTYSDLGFG
jgi:hypothetical protein